MRRRELLLGGLASVVSVNSAFAQDTREFTIHPRLQAILNRYFCSRKVYTRRNIYALLAQDQSHPVIEAYREGVKVMKDRADDDPTSWAYQANIHGTNLPVSQWPPNAPFNTCEHFTNFFLSWHRMQVYFFERIVRAASGYADFALPYWNYGQSGQSALPLSFRQQTVQGTANPLFDGSRASGVNGGNPLPASSVSATSALAHTNYLGIPGFQQSLEGTPHGAVHVSIGGNMGGFAGAGRDPIFWLHHCNVDRLWEEWLSLGDGRASPIDNSSWMDQEFTFVDEYGNFVTMTGAEIVYTVSQLRYQYDDPRVCIPLIVFERPELIIPVGIRLRLLESYLLAEEIRIPHDERRIDIEPHPRLTVERLARILSPEALSALVEEGRSFVLTFEGVRTEAPMDGYFEVYLGLPPEMEPDFTLPHYAGNLTTFGADEESRRIMAAREHMAHGTRGLRVELDVTETVQRVSSRLLVEEEGLRVTLVPAGVPDEPRAPFRFNPRANPQIDAITLDLVRGE